MTNFKQELFNLGREAAFLAEEASGEIAREFDLDTIDAADTLKTIANVALGHFRPHESYNDEEYPMKYQRIVDMLLDGVDTSAASQ